jgi:hypothetical protein
MLKSIGWTIQKLRLYSWEGCSPKASKPTMLATNSFMVREAGVLPFEGGKGKEAGT